MIKRKECTTDGCTNPRFSKGLCNRCDKIANPDKYRIKPSTAVKPASGGLNPKSGKRIKPVSDKRAKELREYSKLSKQFLIDNPVCQAPGCNRPSTETHHSAGRENKRLLMVEYFVALCHWCHQKATEHSKGAIESGVSVSRIAPLKPRS